MYACMAACTYTCIYVCICSSRYWNFPDKQALSVEEVVKRQQQTSFVRWCLFIPAMVSLSYTCINAEFPTLRRCMSSQDTLRIHCWLEGRSLTSGSMFSSLHSDHSRHTCEGLKCNYIHVHVHVGLNVDYTCTCMCMYIAYVRYTIGWFILSINCELQVFPTFTINRFKYMYNTVWGGN